MYTYVYVYMFFVYILEYGNYNLVGHMAHSVQSLVQRVACNFSYHHLQIDLMSGKIRRQYGPITGEYP